MAYFNEGNRRIYFDLDNLSELRRDIAITSDVIDKFFELIPIIGDGNCLFNSISYALIRNQKISNELRIGLYKFYNDSLTYQRIINEGYENKNKFELDFYISTLGTAEEDYVMDEINGTYYRHKYLNGDYKTNDEIKSIGLNKRDYLNTPYRHIAHIENIQNDGVFGSNGDVIAFCYLLGRNIIVIKEDRENKYYHHVMPFIINDNDDDAIYLQLIGEAHYQILVPKEILVPHVPRTTSLKSNRETINSRTPSPKLNRSVDRDTRKSKSPRSKTDHSQRGTRKSKSPLRNETTTDEKKLIKLLETNGRLVASNKELLESIKEKETLLGEVTKYNNPDNTYIITQWNNALKKDKLKLKQQTSELENIDTAIRKITGRQYNLFYELSMLLSRVLGK